MKKQLFLMAVVALAMASCSKDDSTGINKGSAIDFALRWELALLKQQRAI